MRERSTKHLALVLVVLLLGGVKLEARATEAGGVALHQPRPPLSLELLRHRHQVLHLSQLRLTSIEAFALRTAVRS